MLAIVIPCSTNEILHDLRTVVLESADGFWLGNFAFVRCPAENLEGERIEVNDQDDNVPLSDWLEIGQIFSDQVYKDAKIPRCLKIVNGRLTFDIEAHRLIVYKS